jgi:hypothetical protein
MQLLTECGPFFAVELHTVAPPTPWRPLTELAGSAELAGWVRQVQASLGSELRVAASVAQLGLTARLLSPVLGAAVRHGALFELGAGYWQPPLSSTLALSLPAPRNLVTAEALARLVGHGPVLEVTAAIGRHGPVSPRVLAGNLASAANGAACQLGPAALPVARDLLAGIPGEDGVPGPRFRRRSCCLRYRVDGLGYCGDCVLG